jgi:hypothetical protein
MLGGPILSGGDFVTVATTLVVQRRVSVTRDLLGHAVVLAIGLLVHGVFQTIARRC